MDSNLKLVNKINEVLKPFNILVLIDGNSYVIRTYGDGGKFTEAYPYPHELEEFIISKLKSA